MSDKSFRPAALIPVYNHHKVLGEILTGLESLGLPVIVVDDGSDEVCARALDALALEHPASSLVRLAKNGGKGAAVVAGLYTADNMNFTSFRSTPTVSTTSDASRPFSRPPARRPRR